jgi:hypothetical protein
VKSRRSIKSREKHHFSKFDEKQPSTSEIRQVPGIAFEATKQIETGREISDNFVWEKAREQISFSDDGDSNETDESDSQVEKHDDPRIST